MSGPLEPIRRLKIRNKESGVVTEIEASPEGFFQAGTASACGRCGSLVANEFVGHHFKLCRLVFKEFGGRRILLPGEE